MHLVDAPLRRTYAMYALAAFSIDALSALTVPSFSPSSTRASAIVSAIEPDLTHTRPLRPMEISKGMTPARLARIVLLGSYSLLSGRKDTARGTNHSQTCKLQRGSDHVPALELPEPVALPRCGVDTFDLGLHIAA